MLTLEDFVDLFAERVAQKLRGISTPPLTPDRLMSIKEAAARLGVSAATLYRNADDYPFCVRQGGRLTFSEHGLFKWLEARKK